MINKMYLLTKIISYPNYLVPQMPIATDLLKIKTYKNEKNSVRINCFCFII